MIETNAATVPDQPVSTPPLKKGFPVALILIGVIVVIALANLTNLVGGKGKTPTRSNLSTQPSCDLSAAGEELPDHAGHRGPP